MSDSNKEYEEYLIYIHGISQEYNKPHDKAYDKLHTGISACISLDILERLDRARSPGDITKKGLKYFPSIVYITDEQAA